MLPLQRKQAILEYLSRHGGGSIGTLSEILQVSEMTIRRDLKLLEDDGMVQRTHGGAVILQSPNHETAYDVKSVAHQGVKMRIAEYAATHFVADHGVIVLEGGTTASAMANYLHRCQQLTVLTNGLNTMNTLKHLAKQHTVLCCGGILRDISYTFVGPMAEQFFGRFHAETVFLSATGFTMEAGFTDPNLLEGQIKKAMSRAARRKVMLLDSTKFGYCSFLTTFQPEEIDAIITDDGAPPEMTDFFRKLGVEVHVVAGDDHN